MAQLSSDDESDENIKQNYHQNLNDNINNSNQRTRIDSNNGLVEINPFCMDLTQGLIKKKETKKKNCINYNCFFRRSMGEKSKNMR